MRILIVSQYFWPETFRINDLAIELKNKGYDVEVLTGKPNYPKGDFFSGYGFLKRPKDIYNGIKIHRVPIIPRKKGSGLRLIFNYFSYVLFASAHVLFKRKKYDATLIFAISPITQAYPALLHKKLSGSKAYLWLQDLWPESVSSSGKIRSKFIINALEEMVKSIYLKTDKILVQSEAFIPLIEEKIGKSKSIEYIPNWAEDFFSNTVSDIPARISKLMPSGFNIVFAGNIGESQDFDSIVKAAVETRQYKNINWVIIGDGRRRHWLEEMITKLELKETVHLLGRFPVEDMPYFFSLADIMLVSLKSDYIFSLTIPSKLQSYMAASKPILSLMDGIGNQIIERAECGYTANAEDYTNLALNAIKASQTSKEKLILMGEKGRKYYLQEFDKNRVINKITQILSS